MKIALPRAVFFAFLLASSYSIYTSLGQDYEDREGGDGEEEEKPAPPPVLDNCNGVFLMYAFTSREKEYPHVKNASAQAYAFKATATILNAGSIGDAASTWVPMNDDVLSADTPYPEPDPPCCISLTAKLLKIPTFFFLSPSYYS